MQHLGEIAALLTAASFAATAIIFTSISKRIGSFTMSHYRMLFAVVILLVIYTPVTGAPIPRNVSMESWLLLGLSGLLGFFLGDAMLYQSYVDLTPRLGSLITNTYPIFSAFFAMLFLGEILSVTAWLGILVTLTGIIWVVLEKNGPALNIPRRHLLRGIALALGYSAAQAVSFLVAKPAMTSAGSADPLSATLIRAIFGGAAYWIISAVRGRLGRVCSNFTNKKEMKMSFFGAAIAVTGVWFSMFAIKNVPVGIATTLIALVPVMVLPMSALAYKEKVSYRAVVGAIVAVLGIALLFNAKV